MKQYNTRIRLKYDTTSNWYSNPSFVPLAGEAYTYTISNITADHTVVISAGWGGGPKMYVKVNGSWGQYSRIYKKTNGVWVEQASSTWSTLFDTDTKYVKRN